MIEYELAGLFMGCAILSMAYHFLDRYIETGERLIDDKKDLWKAGKILVGMFVGSNIWMGLYELNVWEVATAGFVLGFAAFSKGLEKLKHQT